jgi:(2Fe-2S) ferredoxin
MLNEYVLITTKLYGFNILFNTSELAIRASLIRNGDVIAEKVFHFQGSNAQFILESLRRFVGQRYIYIPHHTTKRVLKRLYKLYYLVSLNQVFNILKEQPVVRVSIKKVVYQSIKSIDVPRNNNIVNDVSCSGNEVVNNDVSGLPTENVKISWLAKIVKAANYEKNGVRRIYFDVVIDGKEGGFYFDKKSRKFFVSNKKPILPTPDMRVLAKKALDFCGYRTVDDLINFSTVKRAEIA